TVRALLHRRIQPDVWSFETRDRYKHQQATSDTADRIGQARRRGEERHGDGKRGRGEKRRAEWSKARWGDRELRRPFLRVPVPRLRASPLRVVSASSVRPSASYRRVATLVIENSVQGPLGMSPAIVRCHSYSGCERRKASSLNSLPHACPAIAHIFICSDRWLSVALAFEAPPG